MSERLVVDFAALMQAAQDINSGVNRMRQTLQDCESAAGPLVAEWEGAAQQAYQERQTRWRQAADDLATLLTQIRSSVESSATEYQTAEDKNRSMFTP